MTAPPITTTIPRGVPPEVPVELVGVSARSGPWALGLLAGILVTAIVATWFVCSRLDTIAAVLAVQKGTR